MCVAIEKFGEEGLNLYADGKAKLERGHSLVMGIGTHELVKDDGPKGQVRQSWVPFAYVWAPSEHGPSFQKALECLKQRASDWYDVDLSPKFCSIDHCDAFRNALISVFPDIKVLSCWPHVTRGVRDRVGENDYKLTAHAEMETLHQSRWVIARAFAHT